MKVVFTVTVNLPNHIRDEKQAEEFVESMDYSFAYYANEDDDTRTPLNSEIVDQEFKK